MAHLEETTEGDLLHNITGQDEKLNTLPVDMFTGSPLAYSVDDFFFFLDGANGQVHQKSPSSASSSG
jgi:hypothetical protein